jgi:flagellar biosynthesis regulator FlaF
MVTIIESIACYQAHPSKVSPQLVQINELRRTSHNPHSNWRTGGLGQWTNGPWPMSQSHRFFYKLLPIWLKIARGCMVALGFDPQAPFVHISQWIMNQCQTLSRKNTHNYKSKGLKIDLGLKQLFGLKNICQSGRFAKDVFQKWDLPATIASGLLQIYLKSEICLCEGGGSHPKRTVLHRAFGAACGHTTLAQPWHSPGTALAQHRHSPGPGIRGPRPMSQSHRFFYKLSQIWIKIARGCMVALGFDPQAQFANISRWIMNQCQTLSRKNTHDYRSKG